MDIVLRRAARADDEFLVRLVPQSALDGDAADRDDIDVELAALAARQVRQALGRRRRRHADVRLRVCRRDQRHARVRGYEPVLAHLGEHRSVRTDADDRLAPVVVDQLDRRADHEAEVLLQLARHPPPLGVIVAVLAGRDVAADERLDEDLQLARVEVGRRARQEGERRDEVGEAEAQERDIDVVRALRGRERRAEQAERVGVGDLVDLVSDLQRNELALVGQSSTELGSAP